MKTETPAVSRLQLYTMMFLFRVLSLLSARGELSFFNLLFLFAFSFALSMVAVSVKKVCNSFLYGGAILISGIETARFYNFLKYEKDSDLSPLLITVLLFAAVIYASRLGISALSRFSLICLVLILVSAAAVISINLCEITAENLLLSNIKATISPYGISDLLLCFDAPVIFLLLRDKTDINNRSGAVITIIISYLFCAVIYLECFGVMGMAARRYNYSVEKLFQLGKNGSFTRLDAYYIALWITVMFLEISTFISASFERRKLNAKKI
ncbi:MAG: GerAB/ArcD/ProY family transporter [Eubacterium sp.]|nr:GerAB/ArcD/ProY family transporter [Eubacterium sp.]